MIRDLASTSAVPVFYAYCIGYAATAEGFGDCNTDANLDLCTNGAQFIRDHRQEILDYYSSYAAKTYTANPNKPVVWLLDGDFHAIPRAEPNAVAAHGRGARDARERHDLRDQDERAERGHRRQSHALERQHETDAFFDGVNLDIVDMVWTTGVGNNQGLFNQGADTTEYNAMTARYSYIHEYTGKTLFVDTSFGPSR